MRSAIRKGARGVCREFREPRRSRSRHGRHAERASGGRSVGRPCGIRLRKGRKGSGKPSKMPLSRFGAKICPHSIYRRFTRRSLALIRTPPAVNSRPGSAGFGPRGPGQGRGAGIHRPAARRPGLSFMWALPVSQVHQRLKQFAIQGNPNLLAGKHYSCGVLIAKPAERVPKSFQLPQVIAESLSAPFDSDAVQ